MSLPLDLSSDSLEALESLSQGLARYDAEDRLVYWNSAYQRLWDHAGLLLEAGCTYESLVRHVLARGGYPSARGQEDEWLAERMRVRREGYCCYESCNPMGIWHRHEHTPTSDGGRVSIAVDITGLKQREAELQDAQAFLEALIDNLPVMLALKDGATGRFTRVNRVGEQMLGIARDQFIGKTDTELFSGDEADLLIARDRAALDSDQVMTFDDEVMRPGDTEPYFVHTKKVAIRGLDGGRSLLTICEDVTEAKRANAALQQALKDAETANRAKSDFLATMSHEIRTPLNGVLGMAQAVAAEPLAPAQRERVEIIRRSGETLLHILNDILDLAKVEAGKLELEDEPFDLETVAARARDAFLALACEKGLEFSLTISDASRGWYSGDAGRLTQVFYNLVSNALKFTSQGSVALAVDYRGGQLHISVSDTGIGIAPADRAKLFQKFVQADSSTTRRFGGTGLGLALCWELVTLMGGDIQVQSVEGAGSVFEMTVPLVRLDDRTAAGRGSAVTPHPAEPHDLDAAPDDDSGGSVRVLAAEDNEINQLVLRTLLQQIGVTPVIAANGAEAVAAWEAQAFDIILMDVQMPVLDGPGATEMIRRREAELGRARTPIIALTANVMSHQTARYLACGIDEVVAKPIQVTALFNAMQRLLAGEPAAATARAENSVAV